MKSRDPKVTHPLEYLSYVH